jgi:stage II sporulation protein AA (anti-sigma F factor antagonist)
MRMRHEPIYTVDVTTNGPYAVVRAGGEFDIAAVDELRSCVRGAIHRAPRVVVDLRPVTFMDTFALRALVALQREAICARDWSLHAVPGAGVQHVLDLERARDELCWISDEQLAR